MKILLVTSRYPWPPRRGDQIRAVQILEMLGERHKLTLLTPAPGSGQPPPPSELSYRLETYRIQRGITLGRGLGRALARGLPLQSSLFYQPDLGRRLRELAPGADLAILQLVRLAIHLDDFGRTPLVVDLIDSLSLSFAARARVDRRWMKLPLRLEARRLARWERRLIERGVGTTVVCERDGEALRTGLPAELASRVAEVRVAISAGPVALLAAEDLGRLPAGEGPLLALTGNLGYFVNVDAVCWWLARVWPVLHRERPEVRVVVAGDRPAARVRRAVAAAGSGVALVESPRDLLAVLSQATLALAPMRCGAGVPIKVLEAWSVGVPVVATAWVAAGTTGCTGEDLVVAGSEPIDWVRAIGGLLDAPAERERLAANGRRRLAHDYSLDTVRRQLNALLALCP